MDASKSTQASPPSQGPDRYTALGGEEGLRRLLSAFLAKVFQDPIIGFFFERVDKDALLEREIEFASAHLGGPQNYQGRPIGRVHRPHRINKGHFHRRQWLLETTLRERKIPEEIIRTWLDFEKALERAITDGTDCVA